MHVCPLLDALLNHHPWEYSGRWWLQRLKCKESINGPSNCSRRQTYRSTLMAQRLNMDAVHSITSMVIRKSHMSMFKDQTPPWNYTHTHTRAHTESLAAPNLSITTSNPLVFQQRSSALRQTFQTVKHKLCVAALLLGSTCSNFQGLTFLIHKVYLRACSEHWCVTHWFNLLQPLVQVKRSQKRLIKRDLGGNPQQGCAEPLRYAEWQTSRQVAS